MFVFIEPQETEQLELRMRTRPLHARFASRTSSALPVSEKENLRKKPWTRTPSRGRPSTLKTLGSAVLTICTLALLYRLYLRTQPVPKPGIPKKLWYKLGPHGLTPELRKWTSTCIAANPSYKVEFLTDESAAAYVAAAYASRPDIVATYTQLAVPILKADLLRYLLLYDQGGVWCDLDVSCEGKPMDAWVPDEYARDANVVVGWEFDAGWPKVVVKQFASWTMMARPGSRHLHAVIEDAVEGLRKRAEEVGVPVGEMTVEMWGDVVDLTGPRRLTRSLLKSLERGFNSSLPLGFISGLYEPKLVGDVLVMPGWAFAASSNHYGDWVVPAPLVTHHYAGSWRNEVGGEETGE